MDRSLLVHSLDRVFVHRKFRETTDDLVKLQKFTAIYAKGKCPSKVVVKCRFVVSVVDPSTSVDTLSDTSVQEKGSFRLRNASAERAKNIADRSDSWIREKE